jgi:hypothetical protein
MTDIAPPEADAGYGRVTGQIADPVLTGGAGRAWWIVCLVCLALTGVMIASIFWLFFRGVGIWGINTSNIWGFAIANYVWWIGIGNAGTLISAMLLLTR